MRVWLKFGVGMACLVAMSCVCSRVAAGQGETTQANKPTQGTAAPPGAAETPLKVSVNAVFVGGAAFIDGAKATCQDFHPDKLQECFAQEMKKANATPAAVEFSKQLGEPGFVHDFKVGGPVDIAYVYYPYRANENQSCLIVNGAPSPIDVDNHTLVGADSLKHNSTHLSLAKTHKEISLWPGDRYGTETPDVEMGVNAGVHIIVNYTLREQCHACEVLGHAWFSFDFNPKGKFEGAKLIGISVQPEKMAEIKEPSKPMNTSVGEELTIALPVGAGASSEWMLAKALDTAKVRLIEHSHVVPPTENGQPGTDELWKFATFAAGTTEIEFQKGTEKPVKFRVVVRGARAVSAGAGGGGKN
jgi:hypothetical protein